MHPTICTIGPFTVYSYGLMLVLAFFACSALAAAQAERENLIPSQKFPSGREPRTLVGGAPHREIILNFLFIAFIAGIIGARLLYIIQYREFYFKEPLEMLMLQHGGLSWFGGLITGTLVGLAYLKRKRLPICKTLDIIAPFVALGQAIGRAGCLLNGCCFGRESASGLYFPGQHARLIPTQIYSSLLLVIIFIILRFLQERPRRRQGEIFYAYLLLYAAKRFFMEFWRGDNQVIFLGLALFQLMSAVLFCLAFFMLFKKRLQD